MDDELRPVPADRAGLLSFVSAALVAAKILSLRGQPLNRGDINECVDHADLMLGEIERRLTAAGPA